MKNFSTDFEKDIIKCNRCGSCDVELNRQTEESEEEFERFDDDGEFIGYINSFVTVAFIDNYTCKQCGQTEIDVY